MQSVDIPSLVRIKPGALDRVGLYLARAGIPRVTVLSSAGLVPELVRRLTVGLDAQAIEPLPAMEVHGATFEQAAELFSQLPGATGAVVGLGGGRALDVAKYVAFLAGVPYYAVPTSVSNDGFCSPQSSLTLGGRRRSLPARLPVGVIVDTEVCLRAPLPLWCSGVGDLAAKLTAVMDWKLAFHRQGTPVNDFAALLSDAAVFQFLARPMRDLDGARVLATALMLNGIAMEVAGSSRPASGSEHLISHALDRISRRPRLHGLQVGTAAYIVSRLHGRDSQRIATALDGSGFWNVVRSDPFCREEWLEAARLAPGLKEDFFTVLSVRDCLPEIEEIIATEPTLSGCFVDGREERPRT